jgi:hypothetical protein
LFLSEAHHVFVVNLNLLSEQLMKIENTFLSKTETVFVFPKIDFMYVRPHHIPLVNQLAREFFWPGIDRELVFTFYTKVPQILC